MTFTSSFFLIGLLPWFIILNKLISTKKTGMRIVLFFLANCLFLVWGGIGSFLLLSTFAALVWLLGTVLFKAKNKWTLTVSLILSLTPLIIIKGWENIIEPSVYIYHQHNQFRYWVPFRHPINCCSYRNFFCYI